MQRCNGSIIWHFVSNGYLDVEVEWVSNTPWARFVRFLATAGLLALMRLQSRYEPIITLVLSGERVGWGVKGRNFIRLTAKYNKIS